LKKLLSQFLTRDFILTLEDGLRGEALKAHQIVKDHSGLKCPKRARGGEGQMRFRMMEERFEEICRLHGGFPLESGIIPNTDLKIFQPFMRFEVDGRGIIFGLAAMPEPAALPTKNKSRKAAVSLNYHLEPRFAFDKASPQIGDIFVSLLVARDRERAGHIEEIAIGIINSKHDGFVFYEPLEHFLRDYGSGETDPVSPPPHQPSSHVTLKQVSKVYIPPESLRSEPEQDTGS
jgi:hypothetical protein